MRKFKSDKRLNKIIAVASARQSTLRVVLENVHDSHNVSAILRTCDAVGVPKVSLLYTIESFPKLNRVTSASANKWIETEKFNNTKICIDALKLDGYKILTSCLKPNSKNLFNIDLTKKVALVFGNEKRGISDELKSLSDELFYIPMRGMIQSLNVSVAIAVVLYEAQRQRALKKMYGEPQLPKQELEKLIDKWCGK